MSVGFFIFYFESVIKITSEHDRGSLRICCSISGSKTLDRSHPGKTSQPTNQKLYFLSTILKMVVEVTLVQFLNPIMIWAPWRWEPMQGDCYRGWKASNRVTVLNHDDHWPNWFNFQGLAYKFSKFGYKLEPLQCKSKGNMSDGILSLKGKDLNLSPFFFWLEEILKDTNHAT